MTNPPVGLDEFVNSGVETNAPTQPVQLASNSSSTPPPAGLDQFIGPELQEQQLQDQYGTTGQQAIAGLEGVAKGVAGPVASFTEKMLGVPGKDILGREEANPITHGVAEGVGLAAPTLLTGGASAEARAGLEGASAAGEALQTGARMTQGHVIGEAGNAVARGLGLGGQGASYISQVGEHAVSGAFQGALLQGSEEASKAITGDPDQGPESALAHIGLSAVLGGVFGGAAGALLSPFKNPGAFVSEIDQGAMEAGDFKKTIEHSDLLKDSEKEGILNGLREQKPEAPQIRAAAEALGAPVMEGMTSDSKLVQKAEDSLINGAPTYSGIKRQKLYQEGFDKAEAAVDNALGEGSVYSKAELGNIMKQTLSAELKEQNAPIAAMYDALKANHEFIPLNVDGAKALTSELESIKELRLSPSSPEGQMARRVIKEVENLKTVDDIKTYKSILNRSISPTAPSGEKRMVSIISDKLTSLEEGSVEAFAKKNATTPEAQQAVMQLVEQRKVANKAYAGLMKKVNTLAEQLGKGKVYGIQDALHFINDRLTPEEVTQRLFSKNNSEFLKFFKQNYPDQMQLMQQYQKGALREAASATGKLSPKILFNKINKLEPEIQKSIFSGDELQTLQHAETYLRSFPKDFNPSGTSHMSAMRGFFEHPTGAVVANARDFAIEKFIKLASKTPEASNAISLAKSTVSGWKLASNATKALFDAGKSELPVAITAEISGKEKLKKLVNKYAQNPEQLMDINANNPVPQYASGFAAAATRALSYLATQKPPEGVRRSPLDTAQPPTPTQKAAYERALDIAEQPLVVFKHMKQGTLIPQDVIALKTMYPALYRQLNQKMQSEMINAVHKNTIVPYRTRLGLSMFMASPIDSTMTPMAIQAAQGQPAAPSQQAQGGQSAPSKGPHSMAALNKLPGAYKTPNQAAEERRASLK